MNNFKIKKNSIRWVVALKEEAQIILDHFKLKPVNEKTIYPIYKNEEETHWLIISGIGRIMQQPQLLIFIHIVMHQNIHHG